ncbi:MAG: hypothetical protein RL839_16650 [Gammaproteobacteria bacterium]
MSSSTPFHSRKDTKVYHICSNCKDAKAIPIEHRVNGKGDGRVCAECERLKKEGGC